MKISYVVFLKLSLIRKPALLIKISILIFSEVIFFTYASICESLVISTEFPFGFNIPSRG